MKSEIQEPKKQIRVELVVRGLGDKKNNCADFILPFIDVFAIERELAKVCDENNKLCKIISYTSTCKIKLDDKIDVLELNEKLQELVGRVSPDEITAVSEYLCMKKLEHEEYTCKDYEGVTIDEIINKIKAKDYKFYTNEGYLDLFDNLTIYDKLNTFCEDEEEILSRINEHYDIYERFSTSEILNLFDNNELVEHFAENGCCIVASTGVLEEGTSDEN